MCHRAFSARERSTVVGDVEKGGSIIEQTPFFFLQTQKSRKTSFCCTACGSYLGDIDAQLFRAQGNFDLATDFVTRSTQRSDESSVIMCPRRGCKHGYCNVECQRKDEFMNGHWLHCIGGSKSSTNLTREFTRHALKTNDLFVAGSTVIAKLISNAAPAALTLQTSRDPPSAILTATVHETVEGILESALVDFEKQFPCLRSFWRSRNRCDDTSAAGSCDGGEEIGLKDTVEQQSSSMHENIDAVDDALDVSDVLVQQAHESWSLLQLLLRHEKTGPSYPNARYGSAHSPIPKDGEVHADFAMLEETKQLPYVSDSYAVIVRMFADLLNFPRWVRMLGSLSCHLVPLQIDHPLILVAKDLPKVPKFQDRKNILEALERFLCPDSTHTVDIRLKSVGEDAIDENGVDQNDCVSHPVNEGIDSGRSKVGSKRKITSEIQVNSKSHKMSTNASDNVYGGKEVMAVNVGKEREVEKQEEVTKMAEVVNAMEIERRIVRLAQAAAILPSSSSSFSSSSSTSKLDMKENPFGIGSQSLPTENPFSSICFFAMALVPNVAVNIGRLDEAAVALAGITAKCGRSLSCPAPVGHPAQDVLPSSIFMSSSLTVTRRNTDKDRGGVRGGERIDGSVTDGESAYLSAEMIDMATEISDTSKVERKAEVGVQEILSQSRCTYVSHSCVPNCRLQAFMSPSPATLSTRLVALRDVKKGEYVLCSAVETSQVCHASFKCTYAKICILSSPRTSLYTFLLIH